MNLIDLLQMTKPQAAQQQSEGLGPIMQFLAQHSQQPQMPAIQMPQTPDYGAQIMAHGLQKQDRKDLYAENLQAKNAMEQQQAQAIVGHEAELSDDPQVQAMLKSGNPQLVTYAMKIAEDEKQKKIAAQYNEGFSFEDFKNHPELRGLYTEYGKASAKGTTINLGADKPYTPAEAGQIANSKGEHPLPGMRPNDMVGTDYRVVDSADQDDTKTLAVALSVVDGLEKQVQDLYKDKRWNKPKSEGLFNQVIDTATSTVGANVENYLQNDPRYKAYNDYVLANAATIARGLGGEKGALAEGDVNRAIAKMPFLSGLNPDKPEVGLRKLEELRKSIQARYNIMAQKNAVKQAPTGVNNYDDIINAAAAKHGIDPDLIRSVVGQESAGNPNAVSPKGAGGLMQIMPGTAKQLGVTNVHDPVQNIYGGTAYLKQQLSTFGNVPEALAAYNAGPDAVDKYGGIPPYKETKNYVNKIVDNYAGSKADVAKKQAEYSASHPLVKKIFDQSPDGKAKKEARIKELRKQAGLQ